MYLYGFLCYNFWMFFMKVFDWADDEVNENKKS